MRIRRMAVKNVRHFPDLAWTVPEESGFHLLYGLNEAGKTTLLGLLLDALYGGAPGGATSGAYDARSHLEIEVDQAGGHPVTVTRRYRQHRLRLLAPDWPEDRLVRDLLGGYDRDRFALLFGFHHADLRAGGENLLKSGGAAGISLFEAGGGLQFLQTTMARLTKRSLDLLDPRFYAHSNRKINQAWRAYGQAERVVRDSSLRPDDWEQERDAIQRETETLARLRGTLADRMRERERLRRAVHVGSLLANYRHLQEEMAADPEGPEWSEAAAREIAADWARVRELDGKTADAARQRARMLQQRDEVPRDADILREASTLRGLLDRLGAYEAATAALPGLEGEQKRLAETVAAVLREIAPHLHPAEASALRMSRVERREIQRLAAEWQKVQADLEEEQETLAELKARVTALDESIRKIGPLPDVADLKRADQEARSLGDVAATLETLEDRLRERQDRWHQEFSRQTVFAGPVEEAISLPVPLPTVVEEYAGRLEALTKERTELTWQLRQAEDALAKAAEALAELEAGGRVPVEEDLAAARERREAGWRLVKEAWLAGRVDDSAVAEYAGPYPLWVAYEKAVAAADEVADTMRQDADRSAERQLWLRRRDEAERQIATLRDGLLRLDQAEAEFWTAWRAEWAPSGIDPKTPAAMREFLSGPLAAALRERDEIEALKAERQARRRELDSAVRRLQTALAPLLAEDAGGQEVSVAADLASLLKQAERLLDTVERRAGQVNQRIGRREQLQQEIEAASVAVDRLGEKRRELSEVWENLRRRHPHLPDDPALAPSYLENLDALFSALDKASEVADRLATHRQETVAFERDVRTLAGRLGAALDDRAPVATWVREMDRRLRRAEEAETKRGVLQQQLEELEEQAAAWADERQRLVARLDAEAAKAGADSWEQLARLVEASSLRRARRAKLAEVAGQLAEVGDGLDADALEREAQELTVRYGEGLLQVALEDVEAEVRQLTKDVEQAYAALETRRARFASLEQDQAERAEAAAQQAEAALADIDRAWSEYVRVELARRVLEKAVEEFRQKNQGGVLAKASGYFAQLTRLRYREVLVDDTAATPALVLVRDDGQALRVGELSDGARDQLFLALRLAFLDQHLAGAEPLPLIMDDVLVHFDDPRTEAALRVFRHLAERTQVFYFTHHERVAEQAARLGGAVVHRLDGGAVRVGV